MLADPLLKQRNPVLTRSFSVSLLQFLQMRRKKSCHFRFSLSLRIQAAAELQSAI
jgi:hypothetical protein